MSAIEFRNVTVSYDAHRIPTLKEFVVRTVRGRRVPHVVRALREVSFQIAPGSTLGVVGGNGAGKSTILRVAAGIITPTKGESITRGTIAPIIELGTGFDPELAGRENVLFNGALLGRSRAQMLARLDEIVEFAGLHEFIDQPLRTYSTGMVARLAFAVATAVEADIILLDEILSVGDMGFRKKCEERIASFAKRGSTVVLVSHQLEAIREMCSRAMWVDAGEIRAFGDVSEVLQKYQEHAQAAIPIAPPVALSAAR